MLLQSKSNALAALEQELLPIGGEEDKCLE
jgi:hypothetical protein